MKCESRTTFMLLLMSLLTLFSAITNSLKKDWQKKW